MAVEEEQDLAAGERPIQIARTVGRATLRVLADQEEWRSICGFRRDLLQGREDFGLSFHHLRVHESCKHRHRHAAEFCIGLQGRGWIVLEDQPVPLGPGDLVVVPPFTWHTYRSETDDPLSLMIVVNPGIRPEVHDIEFWDEEPGHDASAY